MCPCYNFASTGYDSSSYGALVISNFSHTDHILNLENVDAYIAVKNLWVSKMINGMVHIVY